MKNTLFLAAVIAAAPAFANEFSFNAALTSDYRYRGISQTRLQTALQGGADFVDAASGLYAGAWASTITWIRDADGAGRLELDVYAGKRGELAPGVSYDAGVLTYIYKDRIPGLANPDTTEIYGQLGLGPVTLKYSHSVTNLFGYADSKNSGYLDLAANLDAGSGYLINLHAGRQRVRHNGSANYTDWKIGASKDFGIVALQLAAVGTSASRVAYASPANGKFLGKSALQLTASRAF